MEGDRESAKHVAVGLRDGGSASNGIFGDILYECLQNQLVILSVSAII